MFSKVLIAQPQEIAVGVMRIRSRSSASAASAVYSQPEAATRARTARRRGVSVRPVPPAAELPRHRRDFEVAEPGRGQGRSPPGTGSWPTPPSRAPTRRPGSSSSASPTAPSTRSAGPRRAHSRESQRPGAFPRNNQSIDWRTRAVHRRVRSAVPRRDQGGGGGSGKGFRVAGATAREGVRGASPGGGVLRTPTVSSRLPTDPRSHRGPDPRRRRT